MPWLSGVLIVLEDDFNEWLVLAGYYSGLDAARSFFRAILKGIQTENSRNFVVIGQFQGSVRIDERNSIDCIPLFSVDLRGRVF